MKGKKLTKNDYIAELNKLDLAFDLKFLRPY